MSWQAMDAIDQLPADACGPIAFRVLVKLGNVAAHDGQRAWRYVGDMASELGVSQRTVQRALNELKGKSLLTLGEQKAVHHISGKARPVVYDVNLPLCRDWSTHAGELEGVTQGVTEISTGEQGVTQGVTTGVVHKELRELLNSSTQGDHTVDVTPSCGHALIEGTRYCVFGCMPSGVSA